MTGNPRELAALLLGYIDGDVVARKVLLDWLEEHEDPRLAAVREEAIDWATVAVQLSGQPERVDLPRYTWQSERRYFTAHTNHLRFQIKHLADHPCFPEKSPIEPRSVPIQV